MKWDRGSAHDQAFALVDASGVVILVLDFARLKSYFDEVWACGVLWTVCGAAGLLLDGGSASTKSWAPLFGLVLCQKARRSFFL